MASQDGGARAGAGKSDHRHCRVTMGRFEAPDRAGRTQAVEHWHLQVHQDQVEWHRAGQRHGLGSVGREQGQQAARFEQRRNHHQVHWVVVGDQHTHRPEGMRILRCPCS
ncbi:MAG: hypothetical protein Q8R98_20190 [Rubrivivax sp.]|nr:hypothetical protein [Rubrivivax sp.]MDP3221992.1 hypothetical protein [Rubrivivax sp.]MDP3614170.1 hypothetical protein [Rubrivivax sp.]